MDRNSIPSSKKNIQKSYAVAITISRWCSSHLCPFSLCCQHCYILFFFYTSIVVFQHANTSTNNSNKGRIKDIRRPYITSAEQSKEIKWKEIIIINSMWLHHLLNAEWCVKCFILCMKHIMDFLWCWLFAARYWWRVDGVYAVCGQLGSLACIYALHTSSHGAILSIVGYRQCSHKMAMATSSLYSLSLALRRSLHLCCRMCTVAVRWKDAKIDGVRR